MDGSRRQSAPDLISDLRKNPQRYSFARAVDLLLKQSGQQVEENALQTQQVDGLVFRVDPGLGFPASDVVAFRDALIESAESDPKVRELTVSFLGLHGSSSPLPSHMLETAAWSAGEEGVQQTFNDFFSNRLIWLFYLIWRKYRYYIRYRADARDQFSDWMFSLIGIGGEESRGRADIPWAKLLTYLGVVAGRVRSADMISGVIAHAFGLKDVSIRQLELRKVEIPADQRARMGKGNLSLGRDFVVGRFARDRAGKFTVVLRDLSFDRFRDFLPSGRDFSRMKELIEFLLKDQLAYDIELHLRHNHVPALELGKKHRANLGWTTFIGNTQKEGLKPVVLQARG
ncbi:type VI secretion system baseplate subunit TssG [Thalassospira xiamenensis]|uniref:Type VI secretion protein n=1 Tax=Thalassospira xiamenensis TaxID=220697 RepID=A0A367XJ61_9PROT|nr:type VI secretion system baseplate subunit TssG [Thalassospira xiamenensis]KZB51085.1 hypothetical protein AUP41_08240 [Thalassospira xiamenensis]MCK2167795.1 type VI secretion system baseplate subunit TssG [Thalassospira xiamenensis]RCK53170.1 hypothetical protein TH44_02925 [Thalassospira xiamenensis]UKV13876.1 type VI secretion system baseplate subunit TssG [Thalassospiraceae bacterium SW-3-3]